MKGFAWLAKKASNTHSQYGEDGVLAAIFEKIGTKNKWCFEAGALNGVSLSNTRLLGEQGWTRILVESNDEAIPYLQQYALPNDKIYHERLERTGEHDLTTILARADAPLDLDLLSLDIDGGECGIWAMLRNYSPRVVVIEWKASAEKECLNMVLVTGAQIGYAPVYQSKSNIVFVRMDLIEHLRLSPAPEAVVATVDNIQYTKEGQELRLVAATIVRDANPNLCFSMLDIGARAIGPPERYLSLLDLFPSSRVIAIDANQDACKELARQHDRIRAIPATISGATGARRFFETVGSESDSLLEPDDAVIDRYMKIGRARLKSFRDVETISLDDLAEQNGIRPIDFIKMDIQGAELEAIRGGTKVIADAVAILTEVEFVSLYKEQPLLGDVWRALKEHGFRFDSFISIYGYPYDTSIKAIAGRDYFQVLWSDVLFTREIKSLQDDKLLKLAVIAGLYNNPGLAALCFKQYDSQHGTQLLHEYDVAVTRELEAG